MPQAPDNLRLLFSSDRDAWEVLKNHFTDTAGVIRPHDGYAPDLHELRAVDYLCLEWDYAYDDGRCQICGALMPCHCNEMEGLG